MASIPTVLILFLQGQQLVLLQARIARMLTSNQHQSCFEASTQLDQASHGVLAFRVSRISSFSPFVPASGQRFAADSSAKPKSAHLPGAHLLNRALPVPENHEFGRHRRSTTCTRWRSRTSPNTLRSPGH
jgi:hypothetical protein